jgi:acyl-coenzyme A synthetase/AMP-(fatty) acid ligase
MDQENPERLVGHLIERFGAELVAHVPACIRLQQRYDKNEERRRSLTSLALASSTKRKRGDDDEDDEDKARAAKRH